MKRFLFLAACCSLAWTSLSHAQSTGGSLALTIRAQSDTRLSLPYQHPRIEGGDIAGVASASLTLQGKAWSPGEYTRRDDGSGRACYALFRSGPLEGVFYPIISNSDDTIVLDTNGDDLRSHPLGTIAFGNRVDIVPYWTIADVFGADEDNLLIAPRTSPLFPTDDILLYDPAATGINQSPSQTLYYLKNQGWRSVAAPADSSAATILPPGSVFIVRRRAASDLELINFGVYYRQRRAITIKGGGSTGQDQSVSLLLPEPLSLDEANLAETAVRPSTSPILRADEVLLWRAVAPGFNQPADTVLYYRKDVGWLRVGDNAPQGSAITLAPGEAIIVRKKPGSPTTDWLQLPPP
jgi:uncharacterized protein (TIGR02597 family)